MRRSGASAIAFATTSSGWPTMSLDIRKVGNILVDGQALTEGGGEYLLPLEEHAGRGREPGVHDELDESLVNLARRYAGLQRTVGVIAQQRALALGGQRGDRD